MKKSGIKIYDYNTDTAACLMECGYIQNRWAVAAGTGNVGKDPGNSELLMGNTLASF